MSIVSPPGFGRPDYSAPSSNLSTLVEYFTGAYSTQHLTPLVSTAAWWGIEALWVPSQVSSFLDLQWWDDANQDNLIEDISLRSADGDQVIGPIIVPNIGPYFQAKIEHYPNQTLGRSEQLWVWQTARVPITPIPLLGDNVIADGSDTVPANGTLSVVTNFSWAGPAKLWISSAEAVTWELQVAGIFGAYLTIDGSTASGTTFSVPIVCPMSEWQIAITNTTATASACDCYVTPSITGAI